MTESLEWKGRKRGVNSKVSKNGDPAIIGEREVYRNTRIINKVT